MALATEHSHLDKYMYTFTVKGRGRGVFTKLRIANDIKSYITYLISNSKADIYFFTNIEIGTGFSNPHIHSQIWSDDKEAVRVIYDRVIAEFSLTKKYCFFSEPQQQLTFYTYTFKDYSKDLSDNEIWNLEQTKIRMRKQLGKQLRFISKSKGKYTQKLYKMVYHTYGVLRALANKFLDFWTITFLIDVSEKLEIIKDKKNILLCSFSSFITIKNKGFMSPTLMSVTYLEFRCIGVLFYSPNNSPPFSSCGKYGRLHVGRYV